MVSEVSNQLINPASSKPQFEVQDASQQALAERQVGNVFPGNNSNLPDVGNTPQFDSQSLQEATEQLNQLVQNKQQSLQFSLDDSSGRSVIKVVNTDTREVVKQFPPEEILSLSKLMSESLEAADSETTGVLLEEQV